MNKTLIGKNGYLFLQNDSARELEVHGNNLDLTNNHNLQNIMMIKDKYLLIVFPNKSFLCKEYLPEGYNMIYRSAFNKYHAILDIYLLDGYNVLKDYSDNVYYKTDTHLNLNGCIIIYNAFIDKINTLFNLNIIPKQIILNKKEVISLSELQLGIGDLTWKSNLGVQSLDTMNDIYYNSDDVELIYCRKYIDSTSFKLLLFDNIIIDETDKHIGKLLEWILISKYIFYKKNDNINNKNRVLIFYDSFLISTLSLYLELFGEVYIAKKILDPKLIDIINPDYIFEFRVERFLL